MARIVTVYTNEPRPFEPVDMAYIRWVKISEALTRCGHAVDIATNEPAWSDREAPILMGPNLRRVPLSAVRWGDYDVVKTLFQRGFDTLETYGGQDHPFIISKLGSVVGPEDMAGVHFYGQIRQDLYSTQTRIHHASRYITVLNESAKDLWITGVGPRDNFLIVPGAVDRALPESLHDPYPDSGVRCVFAGNVYTKYTQPEANAVLIEKLSTLGRLLSAYGVHLYMIGPGDVQRLDTTSVTYLGAVPYERSWDYLRYAHVGVVVAAGPFMHNNESTKIYHYLRVGLPVVSESGFPNDDLVTTVGFGALVKNGNLEGMAETIAGAARPEREVRERAIAHILEHHTWDRRAEVYERILRDVKPS